MRTYFGIMLMIVIIAAVAVGNSPSVSADVCTLQSNSIAYMAPRYYNDRFSALIVPVSATCSFIGSQLYAAGTATDASTNAPVATAPGIQLFSSYGSNIYAAQLAFSIPPEFFGHTLQISVSIYGSGYNVAFGAYNAPPLTTGVQSVQVNSNPNSYFYNNYYANCYYNNNCPQNQIVNSCQPSSGQVQCVGYLYQDPNACVVLVIPIFSSIGLVSYQYYTLQKLPSSYPRIGTWVSVVGDLNTGNNFSTTGAGCPGNYINVASISTTPAQ